MAEIAESVLGGLRGRPVDAEAAWVTSTDRQARRLAAARRYADAACDDARTDLEAGVLTCATVGLAFLDACVEEHADYALGRAMREAVSAFKQRGNCPADLSDFADAVQLRGPLAVDSDLRRFRELVSMVRGEVALSALERGMALVPAGSRKFILDLVHDAATSARGNCISLDNAISNYLSAIGANEHGLFSTGMGGTGTHDSRNGVARALAQALLASKLSLPKSSAEWTAHVARLMAEWTGFFGVPEERMYASAAGILGLGVAGPESRDERGGTQSAPAKRPRRGSAAGPAAAASSLSTTRKPTEPPAGTEEAKALKRLRDARGDFVAGLQRNAVERLRIRGWFIESAKAARSAGKPVPPNAKGHRL